MNWDEVQGNWKQLTGAIKEKWGKLTDNDLKTIGGKKDHLLGVLQEKYGLMKEELEKQVDMFTKDVKKSAAKTSVKITAKSKVSGKSGAKSLKVKATKKK